MATVIPLRPRRAENHSLHAPGKVLSLRERLFERAVDEELARRLADEREALRASNGCPPRRLQVVRP